MGYPNGILSVLHYTYGLCIIYKVRNVIIINNINDNNLNNIVVMKFDRVIREGR